MKRERINDDDESDGLAFRNTAGGIKYRVINVKPHKTLTRNTPMMPTNLSSGVILNQEDSQSGEDVVLSLGSQNVPYINVNNNGGHIYFMLPPDSSLASTNQPTIMTRMNQPEVCHLNPDNAETNGVNGLPRRGARDDKRRATHNEVERRRRGKINSSIEQLGSVLPDNLIQSGSKQNDSKGAILSKACDYITDLKIRNEELREQATEFIAMKEKLKELAIQMEESRGENQLLRENLANHGVHVAHVE